MSGVQLVERFKGCLISRLGKKQSLNHSKSADLDANSKLLFGARQSSEAGETTLSDFLATGESWAKKTSAMSWVVCRGLRDLEWSCSIPFERVLKRRELSQNHFDQVPHQHIRINPEWWSLVLLGPASSFCEKSLMYLKK